MPKHPTSPPYKSSLVVSRSKETEKHMTTIPKPIVYSKWKSWNMKLLDRNVLQWFPSGYEDLLEYLVCRWKEISKSTLENMKQEERKLAFVCYNPKMDIDDLKAWSIEVEDLIMPKPSSKWNWRYNPPESRYLLYLIHKEMQKEIMSSEGLLNIKEITKTVIGLILANSSSL